MVILFLGFFTLIAIYFLTLSYLLNNISDNSEPNNLELFENRKLPWWEKETSESLLKQIEQDPDNAEARYKFCLLMPHDKIVQCMENALWLLTHADVSYARPEMHHAFNYNPKHPLAQKAKERVLEKLSKAPNNSRLIMDTVDFLSYDDKNLKLQLVDQVLALNPDNAYVIEWAAFRYELLDHNDNAEYEKKAIGLYLKRKQMSWDSSVHYQFSLLQKKFKKILVPDFTRLPLFYLSIFLYPEIEFDRCLRLGRLGMLQLRHGTDQELEEIVEEILALLPQSIAYCWYPPLMSNVFNYLAIVQLRNGNFSMARYYLNEKSKYKAKSEYDILFDSSKLIRECRVLGYHQFAVDYLEERASDVLTDPGVKKIISRVRNGLEPWPKFDESTESEKREVVISLLEDFSSFETQLKYVEKFPFLFLGQALYSSLIDYYKISDWVQSSTSLTDSQKKLFEELVELLMRPSTGINFSDPVPAVEIQQNADWVSITKLINSLLIGMKNNTHRVI